MKLNFTSLAKKILFKLTEIIEEHINLIVAFC